MEGKRVGHNVAVDELRSFMALLADDDIGLFVTTSGIGVSIGYWSVSKRDLGSFGGRELFHPRCNGHWSVSKRDCSKHLPFCKGIGGK
jgi:hypothetical protein